MHECTYTYTNIHTSIYIEIYEFTPPLSAVSTHHLRIHGSRKLVFSPSIFVTPFNRDYPNIFALLIYSPYVTNLSRQPLPPAPGRCPAHPTWALAPHIGLTQDNAPHSARALASHTGRPPSECPPYDPPRWDFSVAAPAEGLPGSAPTLPACPGRVFAAGTAFSLCI